MASPTTKTQFQHSLVYALDQIIPGTGPADFSQPDPGLTFLRETMEFDDQQIQKFRADAEAFFLNTYGLDFTKVAADKNNMKGIPGVQLIPFRFTPAAEMSAIFHHDVDDLSRENRVRDGGFFAMITGPGVTYHGTYGGAAGKPAAPGEFVVIGFYNIVNLNPATGKPDDTCDPIIISYRAVGPVRTTADGDMVLHCGLTHSEWGEGVGRGVQTIMPSDPKHLRVMQRSVLTFPPSLV
jgi:hypothetical protein